MCDVANRINARHASGAPSNDFAAAGVAVHQQPAKDILGFSNLQNHGDRVSASVMNHAWPHLFVRELPGVVVAPRVAATMLNCAFGTDGYTSGRYNCAPGQRNCLPGFYTSGGCSNSHPGPRRNRKLPWTMWSLLLLSPQHRFRRMDTRHSQ